MTEATERLELTAEMLGKELGIPKEEAYILIQFGEKRGWIKKIGNLPASGVSGRGRGATIYAIPINLGDRIAQIWETRRGVH